MKVPLEWLQEYCKPELDTAKLAERLTMTGTKVEGIERHGVGALEKFVVGRIMKSAPHPDADRRDVATTPAVRRRARTATGQVRADRLPAHVATITLVLASLARTFALIPTPSSLAGASPLARSSRRRRAKVVVVQ